MGCEWTLHLIFLWAEGMEARVGIELLCHADIM